MVIPRHRATSSRWTSAWPGSTPSRPPAGEVDGTLDQARAVVRLGLIKPGLSLPRASDGHMTWMIAVGVAGVVAGRVFVANMIGRSAWCPANRRDQPQIALTTWRAVGDAARPGSAPPRAGWSASPARRRRARPGPSPRDERVARGSLPDQPLQIGPPGRPVRDEVRENDPRQRRHLERRDLLVAAQLGERDREIGRAVRSVVAVGAHHQHGLKREAGDEESDQERPANEDGGVSLQVGARTSK